MSELWGGGLSARAIVTSTAGDGGLGGTRFQWILAAAWALECSRPPPPNLLHRGDPEISMCVPCCTCVLACCALPMPAWLGHWEVSKGDTRPHRTSRAHTWSPTRALCAAQRPGRWLVHTCVCGPGREQSSRKVQACSLKSHLTQPSASPMGSSKGQRSSHPPHGHIGSGQLHSIRDASTNSSPPSPSPESLLASRRIRRIPPCRRGPHTSQVRSRGSQEAPHGGTDATGGYRQLEGLHGRRGMGRSTGLTKTSLS